MKQKELFFEMLDKASKYGIKYVGTGNPLSQILIIAKEPSLDRNKVQDKVHIELLDKNLELWQKDKNKTLEEIPYRGEFSPLYPYKGQELKKNNGKDNWGTSVTWMNYQKLYNQIFQSSAVINFHENIFITDLNSTPSPKTKNANIDSVENRKEFISYSKFFQNFPIIILDGVGYLKISKEQNEIENIFKVNYIKNIGNEREPIWVHINKETSRLLINTYQMSINVSQNRLELIGGLIRNFMENSSQTIKDLLDENM